MYRFLLRPKWIVLHLLCVGAIVAMVNLGFWQLRRLDERTTFNDRVERNIDAPAAALAEVLPADATLDTPDLDALAYRRVRTAGTYLTDRQFLVVNVSQGGTSGRNIVDTLQLDDGSLFLINRGFVPSGLPLPDTPTGTIDVIGHLKASQTAGLGQTTDDGSVQLTEIRRIDLDVLARQFDQALAPMYLELLESDPAEPEQVQQIALPALSSGSHLSYAVQWFFFSLCVALGWVTAVRRQLREQSGKPRKRRGPPPIATPDELV